MNKSKECPVCGNAKKFSDTKPTTPSLWSKTCGSSQCVVALRQQTSLDKYGHVLAIHRKEENGKTYLQNRVEERYGVLNVSQLEATKAKKVETCMANFGVEHPMQSKEVRQKSLQTVTEKYGVDNVSKTASVVKKIMDAQIRKYGDLYGRTAEGKEHMKRVIREKYGVDYYFNTQTFQDRLKARNMELFGVENPFMCPEVQASIAKRNKRGISREETEWLDEMGIPPSFRQYPLFGASGSVYIVDGYDPDTNTAYEYNGSYWHGNPDYYNPTECHTVIKRKTYGELYTATIKKEEDLIEAGHSVITKWSRPAGKRLRTAG